MHTHSLTHTHTHMHTCTHTQTQTHMYTGIHTHTRVTQFMCVRVCVCVHVCVCMRVWSLASDSSETIKVIKFGTVTASRVHTMFLIHIFCDWFVIDWHLGLHHVSLYAVAWFVIDWHLGWHHVSLYAVAWFVIDWHLGWHHVSFYAVAESDDSEGYVSCVHPPCPPPQPRRSGRVCRTPDRLGQPAAPPAPEERHPPLRRSGRIRRQPDWYRSIDFRRWCQNQQRQVNRTTCLLLVNSAVNSHLNIW